MYKQTPLEKTTKVTRRTERPENAIDKTFTPDEMDKIIKAHIDSNKNHRGGSMNRWTDEQIMIRRMRIYDLIAAGYSRRQLYMHIKEKWGISDHKNAYLYINDAYRALAEGNEEYVQYNRTIQQERLEDIIKCAREDGELKVAINAIAELNKLLGLLTEKVEVTEVETKFNFGGE